MQREQMDELLTKAKKLLKSEVTDISYTTWITPIEIYSIDNNTITLHVQTSVQKDMVQGRYFALIQNTFAFLTNIQYDIVVLSDEDNKGELNSQSLNMPQTNYAYSKTNLNSKYTFDNFVVGDNSDFANAAALAVVESPGSLYNPLFLYGGPGLGKTHLMHAIGNETLKNNRNVKVLYVTSEQFTNHLIQSIKEGRMPEFRNTYRTIDLLLIDDIQFIAGKDKAQEEFFHTFNDLREAGKQIVISSDKKPKDIELLEERLKTRFESGLPADISKPNYETRMAILQKKAQADSIIIDSEILSNIATKVDNNVRELEGTLNKLIALSTLKNKPITLELSEEAIESVTSHKTNVLSAEFIQSVVSKYYGVSVQDLKGPGQSEDLVTPRHIAMYLCKNVAQISYPKIGQAFGKRDHSTVMNACKKIEKKMKENPDIKLVVETVKNSLFADDV